MRYGRSPTPEQAEEARAYNERHHGDLLEKLRRHEHWSHIARELLHLHRTGRRLYGPERALAASLPD